MRITHFFIDHPRFATVLNIFLVALGFATLFTLPVAQYPEIVPPTVQVTTVYPGASAETIARTVATPLEQEINGVEHMLYMSSQSTGDGNLNITVTFGIGTNLNVAQMLIQNRVQDALTRLPDDVQRQGVQVRKTTPAILLAVHSYSPDKTHDVLYQSNYITLHVKDVLARLPGVADVQREGDREYAMRIWLDPDKAAAHDLSANEILSALRAQNLQVDHGRDGITGHRLADQYEGGQHCGNPECQQAGAFEAVYALVMPEEIGLVPHLDVVSTRNSGQVGAEFRQRRLAPLQPEQRIDIHAIFRGLVVAKNVGSVVRE